MAGTYRRRLGGSLERLLENALDWEHLPWLHASTFRSIECIDAGPWGFRANVGLADSGSEILLELLLDADRATWVSRTLDGDGAGSEIWSKAVATGARTCEVDVEFHLPDLRPESAPKVGSAYASLYERLYDEDESMMIGRQTGLDSRGDVPVRVVDVNGEPCVIAARCPHRLGPLDDAPVVDGVIQCPWHGYRFDVRTGANLDGLRLRLSGH